MYILVSKYTSKIGSSTPEVPNLEATSGPSLNFQNFLFTYDVDYEEIPLQLQIELNDLQCSEDLKSKFLACHILIFYKKKTNPCVVPSGQLSNLVTHTQQVGSMFGTTYFCE